MKSSSDDDTGGETVNAGTGLRVKLGACSVAEAHAEEISPGNPRYDYQTKRLLYLEGGIPEYWIIDPEAQTFALWRGATDPGELFTERIEWRPSGLDVSLVIELPAFFNDALG